jgi:Fic family protein
VDKALFQPEFPGQLVELDAKTSAFVPASLPIADWTFPANLWPTLVSARTALGKLDGMAHLLPDPDLLLHPLQRREALRSSSLEGTFATPQDLLLFELDQNRRSDVPGTADAWREVFNYTRALQLEKDADRPIGLHLIRQLHSILMKGVRGNAASPGAFRKTQVYVGATRRFVPPPPTHLQPCLDALEQYLALPNDDLDPLVRCYLVHYQLEAIHPFLDGNGRVGRLLLAVMTRHACGLGKAWLYMSAFFDRHKDEYIDRLFRVSSHGDWAGWLAFCLVGTTEQANDTIARCQALLNLQQTFMRRLQKTKGSIRLREIVEGLFKSPLVRIVDVQKALGVTYPTARADIDRLVDAKILREVRGEPVKTFFAPAVFDIAFGE